MAGFDYVANLDAVINALKNYNTTTASPDLSGSLTTRLVDGNIQKGDPSISAVRQDRLPAVFVRVSNASENFSAIGATGPTKNRKEKNVVYDIFAMYQKEGANQSYSGVLDSIGKLCQNIEAVFQAEFQLSNTALWCQVRTTTIANVPLDAQGVTWVKTAMLELEAKYFFR